MNGIPPRFYYTAFMLLAAAAFLLVRWLQPRSTVLPWRDRAALMLAAFIGGAFGGKLPFVLLGDGSWASFIADGKTITTALAGAYLTVEATKWACGIRAKTGDAYALPIAVALAIGRLGCFFNGCCFGLPTSLPWGFDFGDGPCHPTQIYEVIFHALMAAALLLVVRADVLRRQRLKFYLIAYYAYRFASEFVRPEETMLWRLTFYQWVSLVMIAGLAIQWIVDARGREKGD